MMIATRSTPSGIVTFKDLQTLLFFFYSPQQPQKQSQKQRLDAVVRAPRAKKEWERERQL